MIVARLEWLAAVLFAVFTACACYWLGAYLREKQLQIQLQEVRKMAQKGEEFLEQSEKERKNEKNVKL